MKLTRRQQEVVKKLIALYQSLDGRPIHYTELAAYIGVSRFSAYDMCKLLEEKGMVSSRYHITDATGPGRSTVVFEPTELAHQLIAQIAPDVEANQWLELRERLWGIGWEIQDLSRDLLDRFLPLEEDAGVRYCAEIIIVMVSRVHRAGLTTQLRSHWDRILPDPQAVTSSQLGLISGFVLGLLTTSTVGDELWWTELVAHAQHYQEVVLQLKSSQMAKLSQVVTEVVMREEFESVWGAEI